MTQKPKLIAMDCDDTLLTDELIVPETAIEAIAAARKEGVRVVVATGRMFVSVLPHAQVAGVDGPVIAYNGGLIKGLDGTIIHHHPVPMAEVYELIELAEQHDLCINLYVNDELYVRTMDERAEYYLSIAQVPAHVVPDLRSILREAPTKVLIVDTPEEAKAWQDQLQCRFGDRLAVTRSKPRFVEITAPGVNKGTALAQLAELLGIRREQVMAIGDSHNDLDMLAYAGISVAVGNAAPEVKAKVDYVAARHAEGGVAEAIARFVLGR